MKKETWKFLGTVWLVVTLLLVLNAVGKTVEKLEWESLLIVCVAPTLFMWWKSGMFSKEES